MKRHGRSIETPASIDDEEFSCGKEIFFKRVAVISGDEMVCMAQRRDDRSITSITIRGARGIAYGWVESDQDWAPELCRMSSLLGFNPGEAKLVNQIFDCRGFREFLER